MSRSKLFNPANNVSFSEVKCSIWFPIFSFALGFTLINTIRFSCSRSLSIAVVVPGISVSLPQASTLSKTRGKLTLGFCLLSLSWRAAFSSSAALRSGSSEYGLLVTGAAAAAAAAASAASCFATAAAAAFSAAAILFASSSSACLFRLYSSISNSYRSFSSFILSAFSFFCSSSLRLFDGVFLDNNLCACIAAVPVPV